MEVSYLLMLQKYINSKQKTLKKGYALCLGNISKDFTINNLKNMIKRTFKFFFVDFNPIDTDNILDIHKYLMKRTWYKIFELIKKIFIGLLTGIVSASNHSKCVLFSNQKCMIQPTFVNLYPND